MLTIKETEYKCQLVPILLKAFQFHFKEYQDKDNIFDQIIPLFEVGRSVYNNLEEIVNMIIRDPEARWNLEGNFLRKFFITTIAFKNKVTTEVIMQQWPSIIADVITHAGSMTVAYASDCALSLFRSLYN